LSVTNAHIYNVKVLW